MSVTNRVMIAGKSYVLSAMTIGEFKRSRKLGARVQELLRKGKTTEQAADECLNEMLKVICSSIGRSGKSVSIEDLENSMSYHEVLGAFSKLAEISVWPATLGETIN
jgi:hypothetical protein